MKSHDKSWAILVIVILLGLLMWFLRNQNFPSVPTDTTPATGEVSSKNEPLDLGGDTTSALFICDGGKQIGANFKERGVLLNLSDQRRIILPQTISGSGARYATADEKFIFWNKGNTAFIEESGKTTYANCKTAIAEID